MDYFDTFVDGKAVPFYNQNEINFFDVLNSHSVKTLSLNTKFSESSQLRVNESQLMFSSHPSIFNN